MSYHTKLTTLILMFNSTELFCVIDDFFLKFESTFWEAIKNFKWVLTCEVRIRDFMLNINFHI
ncbi:hypothetical protein ENC21_07605 [Acinetobacter indicus]|nr:hypothetical protein ENC20_13535 [Acinetobacter indicus]RVT53148.1 hypothetical protein ENC21_07605 [Acinetobacter indicus]